MNSVATLPLERSSTRMYSNFLLRDGTGQNSKFFTLLDSLIGEHQALEKQRDYLAKANKELQGALESTSKCLYCMSGIPEDVQVDKFSMQSQVLTPRGGGVTHQVERPFLSVDSPHRVSRPRACKEKFMPPSGELEPLDSDGEETICNSDKSHSKTTHVALQPDFLSIENGLTQKGVVLEGNHQMLRAHVAHEDRSGRVREDGDLQKATKNDGIASRAIRLQARLGVGNEHEMVTPERIHSSITQLGLMKFNLTEITELMKALKQVLHSGGDHHHGRATSLAKFPPKSWQRATLRLFGLEMQDSQNSLAERDCDILFTEFSLLFLQPSKAAIPPEDYQNLLTIREVLVSAEANQLVAELTNVRIDDLASPPPPRDFLTHMEPLVNFMIFANGIIVGMETDTSHALWVGWTIIEVVFVSFFTLEMTLRMYIQGIRTYFYGADSGWNLFDTGVVAISIVDVITTLTYSASQSDMPLTMFRLIRLLRLSRMMRLLRFKSAQELALMIRGLMGGFRTLCWATVMLVFAIYVIAVLITSIVKSRDAVPSATGELLSSVSASMFTSFRCFIGDCTDKNGDSIAIVLENAFGAPFVLGYCLCVMMVTFGIFNIIIAIYIENTLEAAKFQQQLDKKARDKESLRIAHLTKSLLKKFCQASKFFVESAAASATDSHPPLGFARHLKHDDDVEIDPSKTNISKDVFLLVIQDPVVQTVMDQLELPHDRAALFDVLDADGSGSLEVTELVHGFLKVRGEARRSDAVAALLSVRVVQQMLRDLRIDFNTYTSRMMSVVPQRKPNDAAFVHRLIDGGYVQAFQPAGPGDEDTAAQMALSRASCRPKVQDRAGTLPPLVD